MMINLLKCHGSGNDFYLIDEINGNYELSEENRVRLVQLLCERNEIFGADGVLFVQRSEVAEADAKMRFFNTDGSEAEMCGNGVRCVGRYVIELTKKSGVVIETMKTNIAIQSVEEIYPGIKTFDVSLNSVSLDPSTLPMSASEDKFVNRIIPQLSEQLAFTAVSIPNPHIVAFVETFDDQLITAAEEANRLKEVFPKGVNVSFVKLLGRNEIFVLTYERGVGITNSCGTAMSASSYVSCLLGFADRDQPIKVFNRGGMVNCMVESPGQGAPQEIVHLIGNATYVFTAAASVSFKPEAISLSEKAIFEEEAAIYSAMVEDVQKKLNLN